MKRKGYLDLKVGYSCNNSCIHCVIKDYEAALIRNGQEIDCTTEECLNLIRDAVRRDVASITITGGEPTIRKDFFELLQACRDAGLKVGVQTNGRMFYNQEFCKKLEDCGTPRFVIALHGPDATTHDRISQRQGSFIQTSEGIRNLCSAGYHVTGKLVISRINAPSLVGTMQLMASLGIKDALFAFPHGHGNARVNYREIAPRFSELREEIDNLTRIAGEMSFGLTLEAFPLCVLNDPGYVYEFRFLLPGARLCRPSHTDEFDWDVLRPKDKKKFAQCCSCSCDRFCEGPWREYPETFGDSEFQPLSSEKLMDLLSFCVIQSKLIGDDNGECPQC